MIRAEVGTDRQMACATSFRSGIIWQSVSNPVMSFFSRKSPAGWLLIPALTGYLGLVSASQAQLFKYVRAIPARSPTGLAMQDANTTFADGSILQPAPDTARSSDWTWRAQGDVAVLSSLGPGTTTLPTNTKELVTTIEGLKPGATYAVHALFWSPQSGTWGVRAGLNYAGGSRSNPWFNNTTAAVVEARLLAWETMPMIFKDDASRPLYAANLGTTSADAQGKVRVYIHDLPTGNSDLRTWYQGVAYGEMGVHGPFSMDLASAGTRFNRGVRGLALADVAINRGEYVMGIPMTLRVARGSAIRGVATGLAADLYDWRTRNYNSPRPPTLQFLRYSRDYNAELWLGANIRGLVEPDPNGGWLYYDTNITTLATMAAEWVRYVNHIVPSYRQGDAVTDPADAAILNSLTWSSSFPGDTFDKLLAPGEPAVPKVTYWEIGNEPTIGVSAFSVNNSYTMDPARFKGRYAAVATAIKNEDSTVKVGPTLVHTEREPDHLAGIAADPSLPLDFVTYHPYEKMGLLTNASEISVHLNNIHARQEVFYKGTRQILAANGRNPDAIEYAATEVNVSNWDTNDTEKEARMAHALGTLETIFSHARLGLAASHYWIWPTHRWDGTEYPVFKTYEKLRDHLGDTLVATYVFRDLRLYTTRDSRNGKIAVWAMNFSGTQNSTVELQLSNMPGMHRATLLRLQAVNGVTTLDSANYSSEMPGGHAIHVDWTSMDVTGQPLTSLSLPAATLTLLVLEPGLGAITSGLQRVEGGLRLEIKVPQVAHGSALRYRLLRSENLVTWQTEAEYAASESEWITMQQEIPAHSSPSLFFKVELVE